MSLIAFIIAAVFGVFWGLDADITAHPEAWAVTFIAVGLALSQVPNVPTWRGRNP